MIAYQLGCGRLPRVEVGKDFFFWLMMMHGWHSMIMSLPINFNLELWGGVMVIMMT